MIRLLQIIVFSIAIASLAGCNGSEKSAPIWEQVKIWDLSPSHGRKQHSLQSLKTMDFDVYIFELPAENIGTLNDIWPILYTEPFTFNDYEAFGANSFSVGLGQIQMWNKIADILRSASGKTIRTVTLLIPDGQTETVPAARFRSKKDIFYNSTANSMEGMTLGPGILALRIQAEKIPGSRGICRVSALPGFLLPGKSSIPQLAARQESEEFLFTSAGFKLKMGPGDLVFLGPQKYIDNQITLGSLFFSRAKPKPVVRMYLIVCTRIND